MTDNLFIPDYIEIDGGKPIDGIVDISGAKNSILALMAACLLTKEQLTLTNVPHISDVIDMGLVLQDLGVKVGYNPKAGILKLHAETITNNILNENAAKFRASYYTWGAFLARMRHTHEFDSLVIQQPGGCVIDDNNRPYDFHETVLRRMLNIEIKDYHSNDRLFTQYALGEKPKNDNLLYIYNSPLVSHGLTCQWMLAGIGASQTQCLYNASLEPEVNDLMIMLQKMGRNVGGMHNTAKTYPVQNGLLNGAEHRVMSDRLESATYAILALATRGKIKLNNIHATHLDPWVRIFKQIAGNNAIKIDKDSIIVNCTKEIVKDIKPMDMMMMSPIPGYETDTHQLFSYPLGQAPDGRVSNIVDTIWAGRHTHLTELGKMGMQSSYTVHTIDTGEIIRQKSKDGTMYENEKFKSDEEKKKLKGNSALRAQIYGSEMHNSVDLRGTDLRGTMGTLIAMAGTNGKSKITNPSFALRGYSNLVNNMMGVGIDIKTSESGKSMPTLPSIEETFHQHHTR